MTIMQQDLFGKRIFESSALFLLNIFGAQANWRPAEDWDNLFWNYEPSATPAGEGVEISNELAQGRRGIQAVVFIVVVEADS